MTNCILKPSTAIVLAGGLGTRLRAAVSDQPKVLAPAAGRPFLDYVLAYLSAQGVSQVVLSLGYLAQQVKEFAGDGRRWGMEIRYSLEKTPLGTGGALRLAARGLASPFFALNGDTLFTADMEALWKTHAAVHATATIALLPVKEGKARGCVTLAENRQILSFDEKPTRTGPTLVNGGVYVLDAAALDSIPDGRPASIEREVFPRLAAEGRVGAPGVGTRKVVARRVSWVYAG